MDSILLSIKEPLGITSDVTDFDASIIIAINSTLLDLGLIGATSNDEFVVTGPDETWSQLLNTSVGKLQAVKTYVYLKVLLVFDPPQTAHHLKSVQDQINELGWKINIKAEEVVTSD